MTRRRLPANVVSSTEFGQRREKQFAREIAASLHPASGAGRSKGDMTLRQSDLDDDGAPPTVIELKTVPGAKSHSVRHETLMATLRQAERIGGTAVYVIEFGDVKLVGRIVRR